MRDRNGRGGRQERAAAAKVAPPVNMSPGRVQELRELREGDVVMYRRGLDRWPATIVAVYADEVFDLVVSHTPRNGQCTTFSGRVHPWRGGYPGVEGWEHREP